MNKTKTILVFTGLLLLVMSGRYACFYYERYNDNYRRPWAYSADAGKPLLVGKWKGVCIDPDQVSHSVDMEIFEPISDAERWKRMGKSRRKKSKKDLCFFDGMAVLGVGGKRDSCELWGGLEKADGQKLHFQFSPISGKHPTGFNLNLLNGTWQGNQIDLSVEFAWFQPDGSSHYESDDPRHNTPGRLVLHRVK